MLQQMMIQPVQGRKKVSGVFGLERFRANLCLPSGFIMRKTKLDFRIHHGADFEMLCQPLWLLETRLKIQMLTRRRTSKCSGLNWALPIIVGWFILSAIAILTLEYVNYIRHWGLRRGSNDRRFLANHAWNTEARWSRWSLIELTRHSDHHIRASVPFWKLRAYPDAPTLPSGYYACWWPCLVPPIWRRMMNGRFPEDSVTNWLVCFTWEFMD